ncbi:5-formyltetrahydrofolate cyclo-ligase [Hibiscus syriacus]|uniref:5-formyltetrahydrofolate cyclo-ligase n=1 Tax=Hibiscus syriacus TaxID=106335 RepID=A0A6A3B2M6_HIBSY|nr:5-formyltetrahydrofolate cyclo-ligase, mitochondrial-like isoform X1 [Hibiscus syriacus]KAE8709339.1 5-formyltetrahydrofolate cyclo-ligase [Hibiscus syriacus]
MGVIHFYPNSKLQTMFLPRKATHLIRKANVAAHFTPPPTVGFSAANVSRAMVTMNKDGLGVDTHELEPIFQQKQSLRSKVRKALKNMDPIQKSQEDNAIQNTVVESSWFKASKNVCAYISSPALLEVDTSRIISEVLSSPAKERKKLYVPRVVDRNSNMKMLMISSVDDLIEKSMNILEPALVDSDGIQREDVMQASDPLDLFIMPGLAFDKSGSRLGRSGGYYDLFLKNYQELTKKKRWKQPLLVALSYSVQIIEEGAIPVTPFDIPVDALVSPAGFIPISTAAFRRCE